VRSDSVNFLQAEVVISSWTDPSLVLHRDKVVVAELSVFLSFLYVDLQEGLRNLGKTLHLPRNVVQVILKRQDLGQVETQFFQLRRLLFADRSAHFLQLSRLVQ